MVLAIPLSQSRVPGLIWAEIARMTEWKYGKASKTVENSKRIEQGFYKRGQHIFLIM